uniref:Uncharacterized protein n=1 Tax=Cacopsylla melanoneura TaxID=428564 RepID=A0A8D8Q7M3_9HEMI
MVETEICFHWQEIHGREDWKRFLLLGLLHRSPKFIDHVAGKSGTEHRSFDGSQRDVFIGKSFMVESERCFIGKRWSSGVFKGFEGMSSVDGGSGGFFVLHHLER